MFLSGAFLLSIVSVGPIAIDDGLSGPFDQALAEELGRIPAPVGPDLAPTFFAHGSDPRIFLKGGRIGVALEQIAEGDEQPRGQRPTGPGKLPEQGGPRMRRERCGDALLELRHVRLLHAHERHEQGELEQSGADHGAIRDERP